MLQPAVKIAAAPLLSFETGSQVAPLSKLRSGPAVAVKTPQRLRLYSPGLSSIVPAPVPVPDAAWLLSVPTSSTTGCLVPAMVYSGTAGSVADRAEKQDLHVARGRERRGADGQDHALLGGEPG